MTRTDINSSLTVASIGWDADTSTLEIEFASGRIFQYTPIDSDEATGIAALDDIDDGYFRALGKAQHLTVTEVFDG